MNEDIETQISEPETSDLPEAIEQDDLYPGTFFRIPGMPVLGKTAWSMT